jgi:hypothetical protein
MCLRAGVVPAFQHRSRHMPLEVEFEGRVELFGAADQEASAEAVSLAAIRSRFGTDAEIFLFVRETEREFDQLVDRHCPALVAHRHRGIEVTVGYEHHLKSRRFPPSVTVFHVLQWAIGKHGYALDPTARSKANLVLVGGEAPLPREDVIGKYAHHRELRLELTLRDFTNGGSDAT